MFIFFCECVCDWVLYFVKIRYKICDFVYQTSNKRQYNALHNLNLIYYYYWFCAKHLHITLKTNFTTNQLLNFGVITLCLTSDNLNKFKQQNHFILAWCTDDEVHLVNDGLLCDKTNNSFKL